MYVEVERGEVRFEYDLRRAGSSTRFVETIQFPVPPEPPPNLDPFLKTLELLYVVAGTSYYKVSAPPRIDLGALRVAPMALPWAEAVFRRGLAEYAYRNDLPHVLDLTVEATVGSGAGVAEDLSLTGRPPVAAVGGGKDSIVTVELLNAAGRVPVQFAVRPNGLIQSVMRVAGRPTLTAGRTLDAGLFRLNSAGALNGHVPVTAINTLIGVAASLLHGYGPVVMSNERSASEPNLTWRGVEVNHQWSKSLEAETLLADAIADHVGVRSAHFSLLRGMSELHIASRFADTTRYDDVFSSCNAAYRIQSEPGARWCANCDKCRFVFLALAPFMNRQRLVGIIGRDMFADVDQLPGYRALCGLAEHKPFECVADDLECLVALRLLDVHPEWRDSAVVRQLCLEVGEARWPTDADVAHVFDGAAPTRVPSAYRDVMPATSVRDGQVRVGAADSHGVAG